MRTKDYTVETHFHPTLTAFLFDVDELYRVWEDEVVITSGSENIVHSTKTSLHHATPCQAADVRSWSHITHQRGIVPVPSVQMLQIKAARNRFCIINDIPAEWIEIILEPTHIHIEYQPKRID